MTKPQDHLTCVETVTFVVVNTPHITSQPEAIRYSGSTRAAHASQAVMGPERTPAVSALPFPSVTTTMGFPRINLNKPDDWVAGVKAYARDHELTRPLRVAEQGVSGASPLLLITLGLMAGFSVAAVNVVGGDAAGAAAAAVLVAGANAAADADTVPLDGGDGHGSDNRRHQPLRTSARQTPRRVQASAFRRYRGQMEIRRTA